MSDRHSIQVLNAVILAACALGFASCTPPPPRSPFVHPDLQGNRTGSQPASAEHTFSYWDDPGGPGRIRVKIDLSEQAAYIYRGEVLIGRSRVATGLSTHRTPRGSFTIIEKQVNKRSTLYGEIVD